jgi:hypothetical protein
MHASIRPRHTTIGRTDTRNDMYCKPIENAKAHSTHTHEPDTPARTCRWCLFFHKGKSNHTHATARKERIKLSPTRETLIATKSHERQTGSKKATGALAQSRNRRPLETHPRSATQAHHIHTLQYIHHVAHSANPRRNAGERCEHGTQRGRRRQRQPTKRPRRTEHQTIRRNPIKGTPQWQTAHRATHLRGGSQRNRYPTGNHSLQPHKRNPTSDSHIGAPRVLRRS